MRQGEQGADGRGGSQGHALAIRALRGFEALSQAPGQPRGVSPKPTHTKMAPMSVQWGTATPRGVAPGKGPPVPATSLPPQGPGSVWVGGGEANTYSGAWGSEGTPGPRCQTGHP